MSTINVQLLLTGNELMSGDIIDSNSAMIAQQLKNLGIELKRKVTVSDDLTLLVEEIIHLSHQADVLIINGGLGPTVDDLTAQALALSANLPLAQHTTAYNHLQEWCKKRNVELTEQNLKQAILPQGANIVANSIGSAVGFSLILNNCEVICTPGVPVELKMMLNEEIVPYLSKKIPEHLKTHVTRMQTFGIGESALQKLIDESFANWPAEIELGFRAASPILEIKLTTRTLTALQLKQQYCEKIQQLLGDHIFNLIDEIPISLAQCVVNLLHSKQSKVTLAESCTGGLIASNLTKVPGASQVFEAGFVTYSNSMKTKILAVSPETLQQYGAVSENCVLAMAKGAIQQSSAEYALAISGIAGPDGGTIEKPVGTVCIAWGSINNLQVVSLLIPGNRVFFQNTLAAISLDLIRRLLIGSVEEPRYIKERNISVRQKSIEK